MSNSYEVVPFTQETLPPRFLDFVEFCESQPEDKGIDHTEGWQRCAIGEYANSVGVFGLMEVYELKSYVLGESEGECNSLSHIAGMPRLIKPYNTYGTFTKFLKQWLPKVDTVA